MKSEFTTSPEPQSKKRGRPRFDYSSFERGETFKATGKPSEETRILSQIGRVRKGAKELGYNVISYTVSKENRFTGYVKRIDLHE